MALPDFGKDWMIIASIAVTRILQFVSCIITTAVENGNQDEGDESQGIPSGGRGHGVGGDDGIDAGHGGTAIQPAPDPRSNGRSESPSG